MKRKLLYGLAFAALVCVFQRIDAVLPPLYHSSHQIIEILENEQLGQKLGSGDLIMQIIKNEEGYEVVTNRHRLQVDVQILPQKRIGPAVFKLYFHEATEGT